MIIMMLLYDETMASKVPKRKRKGSLVVVTLRWKCHRALGFALESRLGEAYIISKYWAVKELI